MKDLLIRFLAAALAFFWLNPLWFTSCFTASQPSSNPCPFVKPDTIQKIIVKTVTVDEDSDIVDVKTSDTIRMPTHDTLRQTFITPLYIDTTGLSQDVWIHLTPGLPDNSLELQKQIDAINFSTGSTNIHVHVNHGGFVFKHGILFHNWQPSRGIYFPFTIDFEGDGTAASTDGTGTIFDFKAVTDCFWIGIQGGKGVKFHGITLVGGWNPQFTTPYEFYSGQGMGPGTYRNSNFSPSAAIAIDPFGPSIPPDGGYPGTDAYGNPWATYYRGGGNGSTGCQVFDIKFIGSWIGIITSPNGLTANAEAMHFYDLNFDINNANPIVGCQDQEKMNEVGPGIIDWGATSTFIQIGTYGAHRPGHWFIHGVNVAGYVYQFIYDNGGGYYGVGIRDCFAETLGRFGYLVGQGIHNSVTNFTADFANPFDAAFQYLYPQIDGYNTTYRDCTFRFYVGTPICNPIQINNHDGWNVFDNCSFDCVPVYNMYGNGGAPKFRDCEVGGIPYDSIAAQPIPIYGGMEAYQPFYTITDSLVGRYYQATIPYASTEMTVGLTHVGEVLVAKTPLDVMVGVAGIITAIDPINKTFTLCYIPQQIVSGQKYALYSWKQNLKL